MHQLLCLYFLSRDKTLTDTVPSELQTAELCFDERANCVCPAFKTHILSNTDNIVSVFIKEAGA